MGKKGKKGTKQQTAVELRRCQEEGGIRQGPEGAAATIRGLEARIAALVEKLDVELKAVPVFSPLPVPEDERDYMPCVRSESAERAAFTRMSTKC